MMKKKNQNGFTLVELVIVVCLMGIIMAAVMGLLSPATRFYNKVQNTKDQEAVAISVGKAVANEIQYAKAVKIVSSDSATIPSVDSTYTKCVILANAETKPKKNAPGIVYKCDANGSNKKAVMGADLYEGDYYNVTIGENSVGSNDPNNKDNNSNYLMLNFECSPMKYESGSYVQNKDVVYNYKQSIMFKNLNILDTSKSIDMTGYNASKTDYIYIFYQPVS